jgi:magnesium chelatase subunit ChlD-like protein
LRAKRHARLDVAHLRFRRKRGEGVALHCFVLDCSGSMLAGERLATAKGLLVALFDRAYRDRSEVALVCFGGGEAHVRRQPGAAHWWNARWVEPIGGGGGTPLALGVRTAENVLARAARRRPAQERWLWLLTDGRSGEAASRPFDADHIVVVDFDDARVKVGRCAALAIGWGARYCTVAELV